MRDLALDIPLEAHDPSLPTAPTLHDVALHKGGKRVLDGLTLDLPATGCTVILGPNGAGKSLLLKLLHGLETPDEGTVLWGGRPAPDMTRRQALVFQKPVLLRRSVLANVEFALTTRGKPRAMAASLLENVGLADKARQPARLLSGGEQQRLALARSLATDPEVLLLDEPTASLDPASMLKIEQIVSRAIYAGTRVIFVTHDMGQARRMADDVVFLLGGRIVEHSPAGQFFPNPQTRAAQRFIDGKIVI